MTAAISEPLATTETHGTSAKTEPLANEASDTTESSKTSSNISSETATVNLTDSEEDPPGDELAGTSQNRSVANVTEVVPPIARPAPLKTDDDQVDPNRDLQDQKKP